MISKTPLSGEAKKQPLIEDKVTNFWDGGRLAVIY